MKMNDLKKQWDIWLAKVKFEDEPEKFKIRPVVIYDHQKALILSYKVTGQPPKEQYMDYELQQWKEAGLDTISTIRLQKLLPLEERDFVKKIGRLKIKDILAIKIILMDMK